MPVFGSNYCCEQLFSSMKNVKSRTRIYLTNEHIKGCMQITTTDIKPDISQAKAV
jgi:hypothetical protein